MDHCGLAIARCGSLWVAPHFGMYRALSHFDSSCLEHPAHGTQSTPCYFGSNCYSNSQDLRKDMKASCVFDENSFN